MRWWARRWWSKEEDWGDEEEIFLFLSKLSELKIKLHPSLIIKTFLYDKDITSKGSTIYSLIVYKHHAQGAELNKKMRHWSFQILIGNSK